MLNSVSRVNALAIALGGEISQKKSKSNAKRCTKFFTTESTWPALVFCACIAITHVTFILFSFSLFSGDL